MASALAGNATGYCESLKPSLPIVCINAESAGTGRLLIPNSKTDQTGQGAVVFLGKTAIAAVAACTSSPALSLDCFSPDSPGVYLPGCVSAYAARLAI